MALMQTKNRGLTLVLELDESGSMRNYTKSVREFISNIIQRNMDPSFKHIIILFSAFVDHAPEVSELKLHITIAL